MPEKNNIVTKLGKANLKMLINSVYGAIPGADNLWQDIYRKYVRTENRKKKIKTIIND
jgi:hypothetical protein